MPTQEGKDAAFNPSRYTIKVKLVGIISLVIFAALSGMIFSASIFFGDISESTIQISNLDLTSATVEWTESELRYIRKEITSMLPALSGRAAPQFFKQNPEFIYLGLSRDARRFSKQLYNQQLMQADQLSAANIQKLHQVNKESIRGTPPGQFTLFNASRGEQALLGLCYRTGAGFLVLYMNPERILRGFDVNKTLTMFMVNERGDVILHPDAKVVKARSNFIKKEVVKQMWKAQISTGQTRYKDKGDNTVYLASYKKLSTGSYGLITQVSTDIVFEPNRIIRNRNLIIMGIFLTIAMIIVYFFAKLISNPVVSLVKATHEVEEGRYELDIAPRSGDEVGQLTYSFRSMAKGLGEREKMKDAFGKFVNKEIAEQVLRGEVKLGGEKKKAAVFFSDLRGFTALSEGLSPEAVVKFLNAYFTDMVNCVLKTHGVVDKYIGDAIMAHWGAIGGQGNHTENAVNAGLLMRKALLAFNEQHKGKFPICKDGQRDQYRACYFGTDRL